MAFAHTPVMEWGRRLDRGFMAKCACIFRRQGSFALIACLMLAGSLAPITGFIGGVLGEVKGSRREPHWFLATFFAPQGNNLEGVPAFFFINDTSVTNFDSTLNRKKEKAWKKGLETPFH